MITIRNIKMVDSPGNSDFLTITGEIEWESLKELSIPSYQREEIPKQIEKIYAAAYSLHPIAPIEICSRSRDCHFSKDGNTMKIKDTVYIIDGQQRKQAHIKLFHEGANSKVPRLRCTVYLGTNEEWESDHFTVVNFDPIKVSPSVYMKNLKLKLKSVELLYRMTHCRDNVMYNKVQWSQAKTRQNIFTSLIYGSAAACLLAGREIAATKRKLPKQLEDLLAVYGEENFMVNVTKMFELFNEIWNIDSFTYSDKVIQVKGNFVRAFGLFLGQHPEFWRESDQGRTLMVDNRVIEKLKRFPINDRLIQATFESTKMAVIEGARLFTSFVNKNVRIEKHKLGAKA